VGEKNGLLELREFASLRVERGRENRKRFEMLTLLMRREKTTFKTNIDATPKESCSVKEKEKGRTQPVSAQVINMRIEEEQCEILTLTKETSPKGKGKKLDSHRTVGPGAFGRTKPKMLQLRANTFVTKKRYEEVARDDLSKGGK